MFTTDMSNRVPASLFPHVTGNHSRATYELVNTVGTITQTDIRSFEQRFNGQGPYPSNRQVSAWVCWDIPSADEFS